MSTPDPAVALAQMLDGFRLPQCVYVACALGLPDLVPTEGIDTVDLARRAGAQPDAIRRLLRALSTAGIFAPMPADAWCGNEASAALTRAHPSGLHDRAIGLGSLAWASWGALLQSIRTGQTAFDAVYGASFFEHLQQHPDQAAAFGRVMSSWTRRTAADVTSAVQFDAYACVVDVGGGHGVFLDAVLAAAPGLRAILVDRPEVIDAGAPALAPDRATRVELVAADAFEDELPHGDAYVLSWILHDWDDAQCTQLLRSCLRANPNADLLVVEMLLDAEDPRHTATWFDLEMLVQTGGRERSSADYANLFSAAGRPAPEVIATGGTHAVLRSRG
ncbi:MAG: methyltransferase [Myxococcota bacterium]